MNISNCTDITDAGICALTEGCPQLRSISAYGCTGLTDVSMFWIGQHCHELTSINIVVCRGITDKRLRKDTEKG